ncbi:MAG: nitroreductase family deazaflavin-dependent oxidoreductase [Acidimicrobiia bacterium]|nr:nitroreductase family deazaflavin-dependent oxidoreductase [Acidimicrobiia bacterium]
MSAVPKFIGKVNKRVFNPIEIRKGKRPVLSHVGRRSGTLYSTPLDAHPVEGGFLFFVMYGSDCDWVQNVLAAGSGKVTTPDGSWTLASPRLVDRVEAEELLEATPGVAPKMYQKAEYLYADAVAVAV